MKANILCDGGYFFMEDMTFPVVVECEVTQSGNVACTPKQLTAAGVTDVPTSFCCKVWYWKLGTEAVIIEENTHE